MKRPMMAFASLALLCAMPSLALAQAAPVAATYTSADTKIGTLLDNPAAKAVLVKNLPEFMASGRADMAREMTLKSLQTYAPDMFTDKALATIDSELAKTAVKK